MCVIKAFAHESPVLVLNQEVSGQVIIDAVRTIARGFRSIEKPNGCVFIGQASSCLYEDLAVISYESSDGSIYINPSLLYTKIRVVSWRWSEVNACKAVRHNHPNSMYITALTEFRNCLEFQIEIDSHTLLGIDSLIELSRHYLERFIMLSRFRKSYDMEDFKRCKQLAGKVYAIISDNRANQFSVLLRKLNLITTRSKFDPARLDEIENLLSAIH